MGETKSGVGTDQTLVAPDAATSETLISHRESAPTVGRANTADGGIGRGDSIGRFVVLGVLGAGGMGVVYSAYDPHLDRKVAIKLLRAEARSSAIDAGTRLLREAQAMAKIDHANVIKVHEVGTLGEQVFVAMEFADGGTLRDWLSERHPPRAILEQFAQAGRGLAAAHRAGLVHRDFKPDNVLLTRDGSARVTDFGLVAALTDAPPTARAPTPPPVEIASLSASPPLSQDLTQTGAIMGTPAYMAPEQFRGVGATAATDQFAFCVALYEALYGERPFAGSTYGELCATVLEGRLSPAPKSARVPGWLRRVLVRGLALEPDQRFPSMEALLAALSRDRVRLRNRVLALAAAAACIGGGVYLVARHQNRAGECTGGDERIAAVWNPDVRAHMKQAFDASKRPFAPAAFALATDHLDAWTQDWEHAYVGACEDTRVRGEQSEHMLDLRMQCLARRLDAAGAMIDVLVAGGSDAVDHAKNVTDDLPAVSPCADRDSLLADVPPPDLMTTRAQVSTVRARIFASIAQMHVGHYDEARKLAKEAVDAARVTGYLPVLAEAMWRLSEAQQSAGERYGVDAAREAMYVAAAAGDSVTMLNAASVLIFQLAVDTNDLARADEIARMAEAIAEHAHPPAETAAILQNAIAELDIARGRMPEAEARLQKAYATATKELGPVNGGTTAIESQLANVLVQRGRYEDARKLYEHDLEIERTQLKSEEHPEIASTMNDLGNVYRREGKLKEAKQLYDRALDIRVRMLGPDHPDVGTSYNNLGTLYAEAENHAKAREYYEKALANWQKVYGENSVVLLPALANVASELEAAGKHDEARAMFERALALSERVQGHDNSHEADILNNLSLVLKSQDKLDEALAMMEHARRIYEKTSGPESPDVVDVLLNEATVLEHQNKLAEALALNERALPLAAKVYGADHPRVAMVLSNLGEVQGLLGKHADALASYQKSLALFEAKFGKDHPYDAYPLVGIASSFTHLQRAKDALPLLQRALAIRTATQAAPGELGEVHMKLAEALVATPGNRARGVTEAKAALQLYQQAGSAEDVADARKWLAAHVR